MNGREDEAEDLGTTVLAPGGSAGELMAQGHAIIKIENDSMMQVAVQRPRNESAVLAGCLRELELVPEEAASAFYSIPYKDRQADGSVKITQVTGPSIDAAMALVRRWGNATTNARKLSEDNDGWDIEGVFIDLETNVRVARPFRVSKWYKPRRGGAQLLSVDRQLQAFQSGASKAMRNAVLAGLPAYLVNAYDKKARLIAGGKPDAPVAKNIVDAVLKAFDRWSVTQSQLEGYVEDLPVAKWTGTEVATLRGLWNAINDKQTSVEEVWPSIVGEKGQPAGAVTPDSLMAGATVTGQDGQSPGGATAASTADLAVARGALIALAQKLKYFETGPGKAPCLWLKSIELAGEFGQDQGALLPFASMTLPQVENALAYLEAIERSAAA